MLVSVKWLEELLDCQLKADTIKKTALNLGLEVEEETFMAPKNIIIGKIVDLKPYPKKKNLSVLKVKCKKNVTIVTAAKNVARGNMVLVCPAGKEFNKETVKERKFGNFVSQGILISEEELSLAEHSTGVITLEKGMPGQNFAQCFDDLIVDMSTTPNRPDWLSVEGIARELATGIDINCAQKSFSSHQSLSTKRKTACPVKIQIKNKTGCPRYTARIFDRVTITESPFWMKWRLHCMGMNSVNNIVDVTNLLMLLTGQPLHPFDQDLLKGKIIIRNARKDELFTTLERTQVTLSNEDLVIADEEGAIALAGIIGGARAQISATTKKIVLESAYFDPKRIAHTARRLDLVTEASIRFERGGDIAAVDKTSQLTSKWFKKVAKAREHSFTSAGQKYKPIKVRFSPARLNRLLALNLKNSEIKKILKKINVRTTGTKPMIAKIPHYRRDIMIEEDIYEEAARVYGYMNIPEIEPKRWGGRVEIDRKRITEQILRNYLRGQGFSETYNLSIQASDRLEKAGFSNFVSIKNPLNERFDALRPTLFFGLLDNVNFNLAKGNVSLRFFEIGNILLANDPFQEKRLGIILGGQRYPYSWDYSDNFVDYYDIKGIVEAFLKLLHIKGVKYKKEEHIGLDQAVSVLLSGKNVGYLGHIDHRLCKGSYFYAELAFDLLLSHMIDTCYIPPARYPSSTRDLSFLVDEGIEIPSVMEKITRIGGPILERVVLFDYYKGKNIPSGKKNIGFRLFFRALDRTLTDKEVATFINKIEQEVTKTFSAQLRKKE